MEIFSQKDPRWRSLEVWVQTHSEFITLSILMILGWILRVILAINTGGMVHPDEIYQSLEIAHEMKYGYGFIPWEFQVPSSPEEDGAARSYLFPLLFYYIFELCDVFGIPFQISGTLRVVRIFSATYCTLLIPIMYYFSKELLPPQKTPHYFSLFVAFLITFWFQFPHFGIRTITNSFVTPLIFGALYLHLKTTKRREEYSSLRVVIFEFCVGSLLGLACALRMDSVVFIAPFFLLRHRNNLSMVAQYVFLGVGFGVMFFIQGLTDLYFFGTFLASPINWFIFNIIEGKSSIFGVQPFDYYFKRILSRPFYSINAVLLVGMLIYRIQTTLHKFSGKIHDEWFFATLELLIWSLMSLVVLSLVEHKEERFIFSLLPLLMILIAAALKEYTLILEELYQFSHKELFPKLKIFRKYSQEELAFLQLGFIILAGIFVVNESMYSGRTVDWAFFHDVNKALEWVGDQENSTGVIVFSQWFYTGGWTHLHKNISMNFKNDPGASFGWRNDWQYDYLTKQGRPGFNYLVAPRYQYGRAENQYNVSLVEELNVTYRLIKTVDEGVDIWYRR
ncbi:MAG: hypothetical protein ACFFC6_07730 [Promethearchaeota archaeon]